CWCFRSSEPSGASCEDALEKSVGPAVGSVGSEGSEGWSGCSCCSSCCCCSSWSWRSEGGGGGASEAALARRENLVCSLDLMLGIGPRHPSHAGWLHAEERGTEL